ncbi:hypothetical protein KRR38_01460 [Novosphingobium sp. G106]|uniref:hypothetical protein n=1 Tax=Novosphingobium sp. G106 TaxID=2849500 RepID=UPI001C2DEBD2|nr:hypothetical protein [Novosphingobium sp. G106]MBV1686372.1 hypothetical protein [Novosphingobium sp. G106]
MDRFLGLGSNAWLAIVGGVYAGATLLLALWTNTASRRAVQAAREVAHDQIVASGESVSAQIAAAAQALDRQLEAVRDAAVIQARATSVSNNRQAWINSLRDEVTGFLTDAHMIDVVRDEMPISTERGAEQFRAARALTAHVFKVKLLINPTEGESTALVEMLQAAQTEGLSEARREKIVAHTQAILKKEWERVKSGE